MFFTNSRGGSAAAILSEGERYALSMGKLHALARRLLGPRFPALSDTAAVRQLTARQWREIATRTPTYLAGYRDDPDSRGRAQRRARWLSQQPVWEGVESVLELGVGCGRNLAELARGRGIPVLMGLDICPEAVAECQRLLPQGRFWVEDLYEARLPQADVLLTMGVLGHLEPSAVPRLLSAMALVARRAVVLVEEPGRGELAKGPTEWNPEHRTGPYILWRHDVLTTLERAGLDASVVPLPEELRAPAATALIEVRR